MSLHCLPSGSNFRVLCEVLSIPSVTASHPDQQLCCQASPCAQGKPCSPAVASGIAAVCAKLGGPATPPLTRKAPALNEVDSARVGAASELLLPTGLEASGVEATGT